MTNNISELGYSNLKKCLSGPGLRFQTGPFNISLKSTLPAITHHIEKLYLQSKLLDDTNFIDFYITVDRVTGMRRWVRPQVVFSFDGYKPFKPLPIEQAPASLEWGLNWCVASSSHQYLIIHSAVVEKNNHCLILPGSPGSGKSTLCAALIHSGWRLLSDEMVLLSLSDRKIYPAPRPVSLKNKSIEIIKDFTQNASWGQRVKGTTKGDIEHMRAPENSVFKQTTAAYATHLVFPHYKSGSKKTITPLSKGRAAMKVIENSFNFNILGQQGFETISKLIDSLECYDFTYPDLDHALSGIDQIISK